MAIVTSRYARAFTDVVFEQKLDPQQTLQQLQTFVDLMQENQTCAWCGRTQPFPPIRNAICWISWSCEREPRKRSGIYWRC